MIRKAILLILGAINFVIDIATPFILGLIWWNLSENNITSISFFIFCCFATIFRVIKFGFYPFIKNE